MIAFAALAAMVSSAGSPFGGEWVCSSAFSSDPFSLTLVVTEGEPRPFVSISRSTDERLPDGAVRMFGQPEKLENRYASELIPDLRWQGEVLNSDGDVNFTMLWDEDDGLSVNLWQYFSDGSPSKLMGALACTGVEA